jgi:hypothetical protein
MNEDFDQQLYDRVLALMANHTRFMEHELVPQSRVYHDLGCDGMDSEDLLNAFLSEFDVDLNNFVFDRHFGPELSRKQESVATDAASPDRGHSGFRRSSSSLCELLSYILQFDQMMWLKDRSFRI